MNPIFDFEIRKIVTEHIQIDFEKLFDDIFNDNGHFVDLYDVVTYFGDNLYVYLVRYNNGCLHIGTYEEFMDSYFDCILISFEDWVSTNELYLKEKYNLR